MSQTSSIPRAGKIALLTVGALTAGALGYAVYFDYMRRNSAEFRKGLKKQQKKVKQQQEAAAKHQAEADQRELTMALVELELEMPPSSPEQMEVYFQEHVATAEALAAKGPENYVKAATHFYRALRVYPQPVELLMIYQKVCPERVFQLVLKLTQLTAAAAGASAGAAPAAQPASVADIDDAIAKDEKEEEKEVAAEIEKVLEEAEKEEEEEAKSEDAPESNNGSGASWDHVSHEA
ncbi:hypothetical protein A1Q2_08292 [Trichosporon asahii var. asahii CBS 8904]|uniref:Uncharacterized protein n=2 Tax=Trichosporon asahii var. asahii TaxID=189963 RepID=K1V0D0_TRIAC|nr:hypothetical protein A1Q1_02317 [Trichosporon asahii var. asahii CBS 2479]EJT48680.1 hypothetical protein A1Q1_02317 [Trichosporon asahii var. asahii CBS 2479]EKC97369.1 hypothetical protein A1Q2_08292 [Trichosporon asahii var. asahii CBS 8904]